MKAKWVQNWGLKIGSLVFAAILWLLVTNINDPIDSVPYNNIPVKITHTELLKAERKVYEVLDGTDVISRVVVRAPRSVLGKISANNIVATADFNDLSSLDTIRIDLSVNNVNAGDIASITGSIDIIKLNIEEEREVSLPITPTTSGDLEAGYTIGEITTNQNYVRITGPLSLVGKVAKAEADTDISLAAQATGDINTDADIKLYDKTGNEVFSSRISQNIKTVQVRIPILQTKTVPVNYTITGTPGEGFRKTGETEISPKSFLVAGKSNVIRNIYNIEIPETLLDIAGSTEDYTQTVDITPYLPEGIRLENHPDGLATITVFIEQEISRTVTLKEEKIRISNMPDGYRGSFSGIDGETAITLVGLQKDLNLIANAELSGEINVEKLMADREMEEIAAGFYTVKADLDISGNITVLRPVELTLHITKMEE